MASGFCGTGQCRERLHVVVLFSVLGLPWRLAGVGSRISALGHLWKKISTHLLKESTGAERQLRELSGSGPSLQGRIWVPAGPLIVLGRVEGVGRSI